MKKPVLCMFIAATTITGPAGLGVLPRASEVFRPHSVAILKIADTEPVDTNNNTAAAPKTAASSLETAPKPDNKVHCIVLGIATSVPLIQGGTAVYIITNKQECWRNDPTEPTGMRKVIQEPQQVTAYPT